VGSSDCSVPHSSWTNIVSYEQPTLSEAGTRGNTVLRELPGQDALWHSIHYKGNTGSVLEVLTVVPLLLDMWPQTRYLIIALINPQYPCS
jgi:hypothetical protein